MHSSGSEPDFVTLKRLNTSFKRALPNIISLFYWSNLSIIVFSVILLWHVTFNSIYLCLMNDTNYLQGYTIRHTMSLLNAIIGYTNGNIRSFHVSHILIIFLGKLLNNFICINVHWSLHFYEMNAIWNAWMHMFVMNMQIPLDTFYQYFLMRHCASTALITT